MMALFFQAAGSGNIGQTIFNGIWSVIMNLFNQIANAFGSLFQIIFSGFGQSVAIMFQSFGFSTSGYGIWAPLMFVVGIGAAMVVGYLIFDMVDAEKDITGLEEEA